MSQPAWLARHLAAVGTANPDGVGRALRATVCRDCHATVVRGLDGDRAAVVATADPAPISTAGELLAVVAGARTYDLTRRDSHRYELDLRDDFAIRGRRACPVLAEHRCGVTWPAETELDTADHYRRETADVPAF